MQGILAMFDLIGNTATIRPWNGKVAGRSMPRPVAGAEYASRAVGTSVRLFRLRQLSHTTSALLAMPFRGA